MNPTHNPPSTAAVAEPAPADILRAAALYLQRHGWTQHRYYAPVDTPTPPACAAGAIAMAAYGQRIDEPYDTVRPGWRGFVAAEATLNDYLNLTIGVSDASGLDDEPPLPTEIPGWNDEDGRTVEQVIAVLLAAADEWDRIHSLTGEAR